MVNSSANADQTNFSPGAQFGNNYSHTTFAQNQHTDQIRLIGNNPNQSQEYHKPARFHPYDMQDRVPQVTSSSPLYRQPLNQPTPSPSQCDKCGFVCDSTVQLNEHCNSPHVGTSTAPVVGSLPFQQFPAKQYSNTGYQNDNTKIKEDHEESADILDLDSQKVVYQRNKGEQLNEEAPAQGREVNTRTVPMMPWETQTFYTNPQLNGDVSLFKDQKMFTVQKPSYTTETKMFHPDLKFAYNAQEKFLTGHHDQKPFMHVEQKIYPGILMPPLSEYAGLASSNPDMKPPYRSYDSPAPPQITSTQPANSTSSTLPSIGGKGAKWKSNKARGPKIYNCTACNKWFTSSG
ncbi:LOW QUALITY PROTEIN: transcription factor Zelda-like [Aphomia sociella]